MDQALQRRAERAYYQYVASACCDDMPRWLDAERELERQAETTTAAAPSQHERGRRENPPEVTALLPALASPLGREEHGYPTPPSPPTPPDSNALRLEWLRASG